MEMASSFIKVTASEPVKCERWGCERTIPVGGEHHTDSRTGKCYCLSSDCSGVLSADFHALGEVVGRLVGAQVTRGLAKDAARTEAVAQAIVKDLALDTLPVYTPPVKVSRDEERAADLLSALTDEQVAQLLAQRNLGRTNSGKVTSSGKAGK